MTINAFLINALCYMVIAGHPWYFVSGFHRSKQLLDLFSYSCRLINGIWDVAKTQVFVGRIGELLINAWQISFQDYLRTPISNKIRCHTMGTWSIVFGSENFSDAEDGLNVGKSWFTDWKN
ncbi:hypothetical protein Fmac_007119 [Flemingia macrophylla]|uniref:Uncharacterized protein n=1 Tax=Flemingia macrophylla TaxID=520843 RepID=A0ABD1NCJ6_9FABA